MKWIPVSERLPELTIHNNEPYIGEWDNSEPVLIYHKDDRYECRVIVGQYTNGFSNEDGSIEYGWIEINDANDIDNVIAWMPLPEPYTDDTPQTDCDKCIWNVCNYNKVEWDADAPQTEDYDFQDEQEYNDRWGTDCGWR